MEITPYKRLLPYGLIMVANNRCVTESSREWWWDSLILEATMEARCKLKSRSRIRQRFPSVNNVVYSYMVINIHLLEYLFQLKIILNRISIQIAQWQIQIQNNESASVQFSVNPIYLNKSSNSNVEFFKNCSSTVEARWIHQFLQPAANGQITQTLIIDWLTLPKVPKLRTALAKSQWQSPKFQLKQKG